jgi:hypothetical protein
LKWSIVGDSHYQVSAKYLDAYLDELEFRSTIGRTLTDFRDAMLKVLVAETLL